MHEPAGIVPAPPLFEIVKIGPMTDPQKLLTMDEAAERLSITKKTLLHHIRDGRLRYINLGAGDLRECRRFRPEDIEAFMQAQTRGGRPSVVAGKRYKQRKGLAKGASGSYNPDHPHGIRALLAHPDSKFIKR